MRVVDGLAAGLPPKLAAALDARKIDALEKGSMSCELCKKEMASRMLTSTDYGNKWIFLGDDCYERYDKERKKNTGA